MGGVAVDDNPTGVKAPDGGWGWAVLFGGFVITGFSYAFPKTMSVFFHDLMDEFHVGYSDCAWISSLLLAMLYGSGPLSSAMVNRFGCRPVMMVGGLFASLGMILASFATSIYFIYLCVGVITGLGLALNFQPSLIMLNRYFDEKRPLANGLSAAGSPVALCCLSPLAQFLTHAYGWRGGFLILGGILFNCCACAALMRPLVGPTKTPKALAAAEAEEEEEEEEAPKPKRKLLDFSVFRDRGFVIYTVAASIMVIGLFVPPVFVVSYAKELGYADTKSALLLTILGAVDIFSRPTCGWIAGLKWVRPRCVYFFSVAMLFNGVADLVGSQAVNYGGLTAFCIFFGISYGMVGALQFEVLMAIVGTEKFSSAIGLVLLMEAMAVLVGPPGAGKLLDYTKSYMYVFLLAGCEVVLSAVVLAVCNFLCIKVKAAAATENAMENGKYTAASEMEQLHKPPPRDDSETEEKGGRRGGGAEKEEASQEVKEEAKTHQEEEEEEGTDRGGSAVPARVEGAAVDSREAEPQPNGDAAAAAAADPVIPPVC